LLALREPAVTNLIRRNIGLKASVVAADEREAGIRAILNYGHTIGHAIEASGYHYLHGEAISVGMHAVNRLARLSGRIDPDREATIATLLTSFGLPNVAEFDPAAVKQLMQSDKKRTAGSQTWVMLRQTGGVELVTEIDESLIDQALSAVRIE
jgi:3-dehydroquinate synthetase